MTRTLGIYVGGGNIEAFEIFASWLGKRPPLVHDFLDSTDWSSLINPSWFVSQWIDSGAKLVLSVPMLPGNLSSPGGTLAEGASGAYNSYWTSLAKNLKIAGFTSGILRLGWEMNGDWFPWTIANGNATNYAEYWRQIVTTMHNELPNLHFDFCVNGGSSYENGVELNPENAYPGDDYVAYIGIDKYDGSNWSDNLTSKYDLNWHRAFAAAHKKRVSFPEWGLNNKDNPAYIVNMSSWFSKSKLGWQSYYNVNENTNSLLSNFPNAEAEYKKEFGA